MQYIRIRNLREDMDMTQTDMAKNLFTASAPIAIMNPRPRYSHRSPVRLADFYDVSVDYLLNRTDKREINR